MENSIENYIEIFKSQFGIEEILEGQEKINRSGKMKRSTLFGILCMSTLCIDNTSNFDAIEDSWIDCKNDGGIDFIYIDDEEKNAYIGQSKYSKITSGDAEGFINKMVDTVDRVSRGTIFTIDNIEIKDAIVSSIKYILENNIKIEYVLFAKELKNSDVQLKNFLNKKNLISNYKVSAYYGDDLGFYLANAQIEKKSVKKWSINHEGRNFLRTFNDIADGYIINIKAIDLVKIYEKESDRLFKNNVREFISKKTGISRNVDEQIMKTVKEKPNLFWFLNNGLIILAEEIKFDLTSLTLSNFSIINGAQTLTNLFNIYKQSNDLEKKEFSQISVVAKIIKNISNSEEMNDLIVRSSNTQKPVSSWTFFSSNPRLIKIKRKLEEFGLILNIKEGSSDDIKKNAILKKDEKWKFISLDFYIQRLYAFTRFSPGKAIQLKNKHFLNTNFFKYFDDNDDYTYFLSYIFLIEPLFNNIKNINKELGSKVLKVKLWIINILSIILLKNSSYKKIINIIKNNEIFSFFSTEKKNNLKWLEISSINELIEIISFFTENEIFGKVLSSLAHYTKDYETKDFFKDENYYNFLFKEENNIEEIRLKFLKIKKWTNEL